MAFSPRPPGHPYRRPLLPPSSPLRPSRPPAPWDAATARGISDLKGIVRVILCALGLLALVMVARGCAAWIALPPRTAAAPAPPRPHRTGWVKCDLCEGTGRAAHWGHTGDGRNPAGYFVDGYIVCPLCDGSGRVDAARLQD